MQVPLSNISVRSNRRSVSEDSPSANLVRSGGFSLIEVLIAMAVLSTGLMSLAASVIYAQRLNVTANETHLAVQAAKGVVEQMRGAPFRQLFRSFNENENDDPGGFGSAPGNRFAIPRLAGLGGQAAGSVLLNLDETVVGADLNGDGDQTDTINNSDLEDTYQLLPVIINVDWVGATGRRSIRLSTEISTDIL